MAKSHGRAHTHSQIYAAKSCTHTHSDMHIAKSYVYYPCSHTQVHMCIHRRFIHVQSHANIHIHNSEINRFTCSCTHTFIHSQFTHLLTIHTHKYIHMRTHVHILTHDAHVLTCTHSCIQPIHCAYSHVRIYTHAQTCSYAHNAHLPRHKALTYPVTRSPTQ